MASVIVRGGYGARMDVRAGQRVEVVNTHGGQVCDFFAFSKHNIREQLSPAHTRSVLRRGFLEIGDRLFTVLRNPMLELVEDTVGVNDFCIPQCDPQRYLQDFGVSDHRSCRGNLAEVMAPEGIPYEYLPEPFNLFQNTPVENGPRFVAGASPAKAGDKVVLRALMDLIVAVSACPQDLAPTNNHRVSDLELIVLDD